MSDPTDKHLKPIQTPEADLKQGDWVYTPGKVFTAEDKDHHIFQYDPRINYSLHFGHEVIFYKIQPPPLAPAPDEEGTLLDEWKGEDNLPIPNLSNKDKL